MKAAPTKKPSPAAEARPPTSYSSEKRSPGGGGGGGGGAAGGTAGSQAPSAGWLQLRSALRTSQAPKELSTGPKKEIQPSALRTSQAPSVSARRVAELSSP